MTTSPKAISSLRSIRIFTVLILFAAVSLFKNNSITQEVDIAAVDLNATILDPSSTQSFFTLCNRKLYFDDMPHVQSTSTDPHSQYGILNWTRSLDRAIVLEPSLNKVHGRVGNQIRGFFHAFDYARDHDGALVMHPTGFPMDTTLKKLYLGFNDATNHKELEERLGIILYEHVDVKYRDTMYTLGTRWARDYVSTNKKYTQYDMIQHRHYIIQQLFQMTSREMELHPTSNDVIETCKSYNAFFQDGGEFHGKISNKYTIIHSRSFEGKDFLEEAHRHYGVDPRASLDYPPDLISSILSPLDMTNSSILMITDGQNPSVAKRLASDPTIGPHFLVVPQSISTMSGDILLAILSDVFIGNPASSFSQYIVQVRYALGFDKSYLYVRKNVDVINGGYNWETFCVDESCFYDLHDLEAQTHQPGVHNILEDGSLK